MTNTCHLLLGPPGLEQDPQVGVEWYRTHGMQSAPCLHSAILPGQRQILELGEDPPWSCRPWHKALSLPLSDATRPEDSAEAVRVSVSTLPGSDRNLNLVKDSSLPSSLSPSPSLLSELNNGGNPCQNFAENDNYTTGVSTTTRKRPRSSSELALAKRLRTDCWLEEDTRCPVVCADACTGSVLAEDTSCSVVWGGTYTDGVLEGYPGCVLEEDTSCPVVCSATRTDCVLEADPSCSVVWGATCTDGVLEEYPGCVLEEDTSCPVVWGAT